MSEFVQGQRWVVDSEPELGLGIVVAVEGRTVSIFFPIADEERRYAFQQAPLTRINFHIEDDITTLDGNTHTVTNVHNQAGLLIYETSAGEVIPETRINAEIKLNQPFMRLLMGQIDKARWFYFRRELDSAMSKVWTSRLNGLLGVRASLIPHQLYVANTACEREQVRVLLADEVGLGKTIEAGMILNRLLKLHKITRALIVVPEALQVQWLVELIRRFNIQPSIYAPGEHDFNDGQIHLIPHHALASEHDALLEAGFDITVVDEAHNIHADDETFVTLKSLAELCPHLVLMTATPEQLGFDSHFSRLQLLDPAKYASPAAVRAEEQGYERLNKLIKQLPESKAELVQDFHLDADLDDDALLNQALDCHGIGRVMFRNSRSAVSGFPNRLPQAYTLGDAEWETRFEWLAKFLKQNPDEKILVITHHLDQVIDCERYLWGKHGLDAAVFHEELSLIERDRAAAYFADIEDGARVMLCSEIGSEGRNFQFSHNLVCLDLPEHPDLLEQRIGRLDRIGQAHDVKIHALISDQDDSAARWQWFNDTLDCVAQQNPAAGTVHDEFWPGNYSAINAKLSVSAKKEVLHLAEEIRNGRDALLELNSCREPDASELAKRIEEFEKNTPLPLVEMASNLLNFHFEDLGAGRYSLLPADNMMISALPGIPPEGIELTFDRDIANTREDVIFMSWDAPFITGLWEMLHHSELGSATVAMLTTRQLPAGKCLLEASFDVVVQAQNNAECLPFLSSMSVRTLTLESVVKDLAAALPDQQLQDSLKKVDKKLARQIIKSQKENLTPWFDVAEKVSLAKKDTLVTAAVEKSNRYFDYEIERLKMLASRNNAVDDSDIDRLQASRKAVENALTTQTHLQLSALRLIVTNSP